MNILGKLEKVDLRQVWETEDRDFTPWLAKEEHLQILADTIGMDLELEAQEKDVGPFRADILCKNIDDDSWVLVENQIEKTDHRHLGQLITYASGLQAVTIVWIASNFTEEHRAALDWLNKITDDHFRFFGLELELWRINDSPPAPKFNVISKPNNWSKSISQAAKRISEQATTETTELQYRYWQKLLDFMRDNGTQLRLQKPMPQHWQTFAIGRSHFHMAALLNTRENRIAVELCITDPNNAKIFYKLLEMDKENIELEIGAALDWKELPEKTSSKVLLYKDADPTDENDWKNQHKWMQEKLETFSKVFRSRVRQLDPGDWAGEDDELA